MPHCPIVTKIYPCVDTLKLLLLVYRGGLCRMVNIRVNTCTCMDCLPGKKRKLAMLWKGDH